MLWQLSVSAGLVRAELLPTPGEVSATLLDLVFANSGAAGRYSGDWPEHAAASLIRVYAGSRSSGFLDRLSGSCC